MTEPSDARIGVLLPVRNGGDTLRDALDSLVSQSFERFRCYVVDDGSEDDTFDIASRVAQSDSRFEVLRQEGAGIVPALLHAFEFSSEPLIARQDADDVSHPERFEKQLDSLDADPSLDLVASSVVVSSSSEITEGWRRYMAWLDDCRSVREIANNLWIESPLPHPTVLMRRAAYERAGGYRDLGWPEDYDLWLRMRRLGMRMRKRTEALYRWVDHEDRASRTLPQYQLDRFLDCRVHHLKEFLQDRTVTIWGAGRDGRRAARRLLDSGVEVDRFLDIDPKKIGRRAYDRPIVDATAWLAREPSPNSTLRPDDDELPELATDRPIVLAAVGSAGARPLIREALDRHGYIEGVHFLCLA